MGFFNSFSVRITLAVIGGVVYSLLTYCIVTFLGLSYEYTILVAIFVFLFYFGSRLLILFSGIDSPYYSRSDTKIFGQVHEKDLFYETTQWVGRFYHYHDIVLFAFLILISMAFLISVMMDWSGSKPIGNTFQGLFGG